MTVKEQLSVSNQKIIKPNKELVGVKKSKKKKLMNHQSFLIQQVGEF